MNSNCAPWFPARCVGGLLMIILLTGCAEFLAAQEQRAQGWREARVVKVAAGELIAPTSSRDCRKEAAPDTAAKDQYALYQYKGVGSSRRYIIARYPDNVPFKVGDPVLVNIENCSLAPTLR